MAFGVLLALVASTPTPMVVVLGPQDLLDDGAVADALGSATQVIRATPNPADGTDQEALWDQVGALLRKAGDLTLQLKVGEAVKKYDQAIAALEKNLPHLTSLNLLAQCFIDLGVALLSDGKVRQAERALRSGLVLAPDWQPDPALYNPETVDRIRATLARLGREQMGAATILTEVEDAQILLDGREVGQGSVTLQDLPLGVHWVVVRHPAYEPFSSRVRVRRNDVTRVEVFLKARSHPHLAWLAIDAPDIQARTAALERLRLATESQVAVMLQTASAGLEAQRVSQGDTVSLRAKDLPTMANLLHQHDHSASVVTNPAPAAPSEAVAVPIALLPFGVGQYVEGRPVAGTLFLIGELVLLASNLISYVILQNERFPDGTWDDPGRATTLTAITNVAFGLLITTFVAGAIDGLVHRDD